MGRRGEREGRQGWKGGGMKGGWANGGGGRVAKEQVGRGVAGKGGSVWRMSRMEG